VGSRWLKRDPHGSLRPAVVGFALAAVLIVLVVLILALLGQKSTGGP
jgi:hypothetical protein